ncbi:predicted protein [Naegleria gruberi]|uniref:Predicted protein n=1 Tax=Naegleria gruberi TaxID=5762 RepID=D2VV88_NAEGR|nr:uncharacterized protein NAEGRDRAFT_72930 [Naegleria gruberi]EFC39192.1 predicted protein [Naegleria gruberi]|eukprot:XP_002671936.1 predicted protein [Naegleria gruberi strain NEG-M]
MSNENSWKSVQNKPRSGRKQQQQQSPTTTPATTTTTTTNSNSNTSGASISSNNINISSPTNPTTSTSLNHSQTITNSPSVALGGNQQNNATTSNTSSAKKKTNNVETNEKVHPLGDTFTFSYFRKEKGIDYEDCMKNVGDFSTVEQFWALYTHMKRPYELKVSMDYHLFKQGIKPMWEDDKNKTGGRLMLRCKSGYSARIWEDLLLAFIGQQFKNTNDVNGVVISIRENHDIISIWNADGEKEEIQEALKQDAMKLLNLPSQTKLEYKPHQESINNHTKMLEMIGNNATSQGFDEDAVTELDQELEVYLKR